MESISDIDIAVGRDADARPVDRHRALYVCLRAWGSYLKDNPAACINCHVMRDQYAGWLKDSHRSVAVCNDCHTPDGMIAKYAAKARYGFLHAYAFTTGRFPDEIQIMPPSGHEGHCMRAVMRKTTACLLFATEFQQPAWSACNYGIKLARLRER